MPVTFKDLENFIVVSESKTLSEASEKLEMAQPSLSLAIKKLETELDMPLFIRSREGIKLTPQGKVILPQAQEAIKILQKITGWQIDLRFKIGCHPSVGMFVLGDFLKIMHKEAPRMDFEIINGSSHDINKLVARGEIDFGIVMNPMKLPGLITRFIGEDEIFVWESKSRYKDRIIYNPNMLQARSILSRWKESNLERIEVENLELIANLVESGAGYGILPSQVVKAQKLNLKKIPNAPTYRDKLALVCYPEMLALAEGRKIFETLKISFKS